MQLEFSNNRISVSMKFMKQRKGTSRQIRRQSGSSNILKLTSFKKHFLKFAVITGCSISTVLPLTVFFPVYANTSVANDVQAKKFELLMRKFQDVPLEQGDPRFVRFNAFSREGKEAIRLYRIAVAIMKSKPASNPYSWDVQSGIHGTFWTSIEQLKQGMIKHGYFNDPSSDPNLSNSDIHADAQARAEKAFGSWEVLLNNCNHWAQLWSQAQGIHHHEGTTKNFSVVFQAWHRLYLSAFEKVVRQVLIDEKANPVSPYKAILAASNVDTWSLPYWDYRDPKTGSIPEEFRNPQTPSGQPNSLYEPVRSQIVNQGVSVQNIPLPDSDLGLLSSTLLPGKKPGAGYTVGNYYNASVVLQQAQNLFASFNSLSELSPHAVGHDIIGGLADSQEGKLERWLAMVDLARRDGLSNFWRADESPENLQEILQGKSLYEFAKDPKNREIFIRKVAPSAIPTIFGSNPSIGPTLIGWVPTAARDPIFWLHHAYVDKLWSEYNTMRSGSFLDEGTLDDAGWNFTFWEPGQNGKPSLKSYSTWKNARFPGRPRNNISSNRVLMQAYYPTYTYDYIQPLDINYKPITSKSNKLLALLESANISPSLSKITDQSDDSQLKQPLSRLSFNAININSPLHAGVIKRIAQADNIQVSIELNLKIPMHSSENIGIIVGDLVFLKENAEQIQLYWNSWKVGAGLGGRDGAFVPDERLSLKGLDGTKITGAAASKLLGKMSLARFNPLAMSNEQSGMARMAMNTHYTTDLTPVIVNQFEIANKAAMQDSSRIGIMLLTSNPGSKASQNTFISKISTTLHVSLNSDTLSDGFDPIQLLVEDPALVDNAYAMSDLEAWYNKNKSNFSEKPTYLGRALRLSYVYLASNPDLILKYRNQPLSAIEHYLTQGLREGRSLDGWTRSDVADLNSKETIEFQAKQYVLSYK